MSRENCDDGCGELATQRLRYFTGRHMTARDFRDEQAYHRTHRLLHNRMLHGWGVVCGLHVEQHPNASCRKDHVKVSCGFALDCCGREIPVQKDVVPPPVPWNERPHDQHEYVPLLCLEYCQSDSEPVPVLYSEQNCDPQRRENSRIDESYGFNWHWVRVSNLPEFHWKTNQGGCPDAKEGSPCPEDDCEGGHGPRRCCLEPRCPPHHCVPIAYLKPSDGAIGADDIVMLGRPELDPPSHLLTHICRINWPHGEDVTLDELTSKFSELRISFDRRLRKVVPQTCGPNGVNACTFTVQFGGGPEDLDFVSYAAEPYVENDCVAVFKINPDANDPRFKKPYSYLRGQIVFITLKCDFVLDCHGHAVDGNHIGGTLPSGDGIKGGTFESWFRVVSDDEKNQNTNQAPKTEQTS